MNIRTVVIIMTVPLVLVGFFLILSTNDQDQHLEDEPSDMGSNTNNIYDDSTNATDPSAESGVDEGVVEIDVVKCTPEDVVANHSGYLEVHDESLYLSFYVLMHWNLLGDCSYEKTYDQVFIRLNVSGGAYAASYSNKTKYFPTDLSNPKTDDWKHDLLTNVSRNGTEWIDTTNQTTHFVVGGVSKHGSALVILPISVDDSVGDSSVNLGSGNWPLVARTSGRG